MTSISKKCIDDIVNEYKNTYHRTIKIKPVNVKDTYNKIHILTLSKQLMIKILNLKLMIM